MALDTSSAPRGWRRFLTTNTKDALQYPTVTDGQTANAYESDTGIAATPCAFLGFIIGVAPATQDYNVQICNHDGSRVYLDITLDVTATAGLFVPWFVFNNAATAYVGINIVTNPHMFPAGDAGLLCNDGFSIKLVSAAGGTNLRIYPIFRTL